ncbi:MAG TPA: hypothetical protein VGA36_01655, partial [Nitriliruptorales bacterium]
MLQRGQEQQACLAHVRRPGHREQPGDDAAVEPALGGAGQPDDQALVQLGAAPDAGELRPQVLGCCCAVDAGGPRRWTVSHPTLASVLMDLVVNTPAQERLRDELLGWGAPRPPADHELRTELRARIEDGVAPVVDLVPDGQRLFVSKSRLDALACDGRFLDLLEDDFAWNVDVARGKLAHRAIELDWRTRRGHTAAALVEYAWQAYVRDGDSLGEYLGQLQGIEADQLRTDAQYLVNEFRDTWPSIPEQATMRLETPIQASFGQPRVVKASGTPDLLLG